MPKGVAKVLFLRAGAVSLFYRLLPVTEPDDKTCMVYPSNQRQPFSSLDPRRHWSRRGKIVCSLLLMFHLTATFAAPWSSPPPAPLLADWINRILFLRPYQAVAYLNHGYRFFAPNPGPSFVIRYEVERADGEIVRGRLPDSKRHWPRLLYHRHLMISDRLYSIRRDVVDETPPGLTPTQLREFQSRNQRARDVLTALARGVARQLLIEFDGQRVRLYLQRHNIPFPEQVQQGARLDDPESYVDEFDLGEFGRNEP